MAFQKISNFHGASIETLNVPSGWDIINTSGFKKIASASNKDNDVHGFDLKQAIEKYPDHLFIKIFAIKEDEPNDNADCFSQAEEEKSAHTFVGVPLFSNHKNDDIENSRGECVHAWYDPEVHGIWIIGRVDKVAFPKLARAIEEGYITGTSMGCSVEYAVCSICHNLAHNADEYCVHIRESKNRKRSGVYECQFHQSKNIGNHEECLISDCRCQKNDKKIHRYDNKTIFEWNYGIRFIENSFVVNPACHTCGVSCVLHVPSVEEKIAHIKENIEKISQKSNSKQMKKVAGKLEIDMLKQAMTNLEKVVQSMLSQKDYVDVSYPSEVIDAMSKIQTTTDELVEAGYMQLDSPEIIKQSYSNVLEENKNTPQKPPVSPQSAAINTNNNLLNNMQSNQTNTGSNFSQMDLGKGLGTITMPKNANTKKEFIQTSRNILKMMTKIKNLSDKSMVS